MTATCPFDSTSLIVAILFRARSWPPFNKLFQPAVLSPSVPHSDLASSRHAWIMKVPMFASVNDHGKLGLSMVVKLLFPRSSWNGLIALVIWLGRSHPCRAFRCHFNFALLYLMMQNAGSNPPGWSTEADACSSDDRQPTAFSGRDRASLQGRR